MTETDVRMTRAIHRQAAQTLTYRGASAMKTVTALTTMSATVRRCASATIALPGRRFPAMTGTRARMTRAIHREGASTRTIHRHATTEVFAHQGIFARTAHARPELR